MLRQRFNVYFSAAMVLRQDGTDQMVFEGLKDLSSDLKVAKERVEFDMSLKFDESLLAHPAIQAVVAKENGLHKAMKLQRTLLRRP